MSDSQDDDLMKRLSSDENRNKDNQGDQFSGENDENGGTKLKKNRESARNSR